MQTSVWVSLLAFFFFNDSLSNLLISFHLLVLLMLFPYFYYITCDLLLGLPLYGH